MRVAGLKTLRWSARLLIVGAVVVVAFMPGNAMAALFIGTVGDDNFHGTPNPDEFRMMAGDDTVHADDGQDTLEMGDNRDFGYGEGGGDLIRGGDNSTSSFEEMLGGDGHDDLYDLPGPDQDKACGGPGDDFSDVHDLDGQDSIKGGGGTDSWSKDSGDNADQAANC